MGCTYSLSSTVRYNALDELHIDPASKESLNLIQTCHSTYQDFSNQYRRQFNLGRPESIDLLYSAATEAGIFTLAQHARSTFFGKDIHFYGVTYLWDFCMESCIYCPAAITNRQKTKYKPLSLTIDEAVKDVCYIMQDGHRHLCVLSGEDPIRYPPAVIAEYIQAFDQLGLKEIILNIEPPADWEDFKLWRSAAKYTSLQFRVFQETYNRKKYTEIHPRTKYGRKHDYDRRYQSQFKAIEYGFDHVGLGVLFGNYAYPLEEIDNVKQHAEELKATTGKFPARVCLPSAKYLETIQVDIPYSLSEINQQGVTPVKSAYWKFSELIYALSRIAMPTISIVSSERDEANLLSELDQYVTCTTLNVHPGVGDNIRFHEKKLNQQIHFEQAPSFSRNPAQTINRLKTNGYRPWLVI